MHDGLEESSIEARQAENFRIQDLDKLNLPPLANAIIRRLYENSQELVQNEKEYIDEINTYQKRIKELEEDNRIYFEDKRRVVRQLDDEARCFKTQITELKEENQKLETQLEHQAEAYRTELEKFQEEISRLEDNCPPPPSAVAPEISGVR
jgi:septal ring factor EnvC (AmiA/AmiB activator)